MNGRPHAAEILSILNTLKNYLPKERNEAVYSIEQMSAFFDEVVKNKYADQLPPETLWPVINDIKRNFLDKLADIPADNKNKLMSDDIENAIVKAFYSQYFEKAFTCEQLMKLHPDINPNPYLEDYYAHKYFEEGAGGASQLAMDVTRGTMIMGKKFNPITLEDKIPKESIADYVNDIVKDENITNSIIAAYSQRPIYLLAYLIGHSMIIDGTMQMDMNNPSLRSENIRLSGDNIYFDCTMKSFSIFGPGINKPVVHTFDGALASFKYEKHVNPDESTVEGFKLVEIRTCDPYNIMVLSEGQTYTPEQIMDYVDHYYPELLKKTASGSAKFEDLDAYLIKNSIYKDLLLKDLKQKIRLFSPETDADGIKELIKLNNKSMINSIEDIANVCSMRIKLKSSGKDKFFPEKPSSRDSEYHLFYQACAAYKDNFSLYPRIATTEELIDSQQKVEILYHLKSELNRRTINNLEDVKNYEKLIINIEKSSPSESSIKILGNSNLKDDKLVKSLFDKLLEPKAVMEKILQGNKKQIFGLKF